MPKFLPVALLIVGLVMLGAACGIKTNITSGNTNITVSTNVNATITNSGATGTFSTNSGQ